MLDSLSNSSHASPRSFLCFSSNNLLVNMFLSALTFAAYALLKAAKYFGLTNLVVK